LVWNSGGAQLPQKINNNKNLRNVKGISMSGASYSRPATSAAFFAQNLEVAGFGGASDAIYQTVRELTENALDATSSARDGKVEVALQLNYKANELHVVVRDSGPSMRSKDVPHL
jgi:DNA topoisomerase VI subunit B